MKQNKLINNYLRKSFQLAIWKNIKTNHPSEQ